MIRRLFYMALGAFGAVWVMRKLNALRPDHVARRTADSAMGMLAQVRDFTSDALGEAAGRETELRTQFGLDQAEKTN